MSFSRRITVETPEHVALEFELAGVGSRAAALVYDSFVLAALFILLFAAQGALGGFGDAMRGWATAVWIVVASSAVWGYFVLFEAMAGGRTPGKRRVGIRVVMETGHPVTFAAAATRNLVRLLDLQPGGAHLLGLAFVFFHGRNKRLGDMVAGTIVVRDRPEEIALAQPAALPVAGLQLGSPTLSDEEFALLERFLNRADTLGAQVRGRFASELSARFADRLPAGSPGREQALVRLYTGELARRQARQRGKAGRSESGPSALASKFVSTRQGSWERFRARASALERSGLTGLDGTNVVAFAAEYREIAADLARARTYGVDSRLVSYLERIVGAGHNALYGLRGVTRFPIMQLLGRDLPAAVVQARRYVLAAFLVFLIPGFIGFGVIRGRPDVAERMLPDEMIARAESGASRQAEGRGYAEAPSPYLPVVATSIVANNIQVAFSAFAFGITAGIGTALVLAFNGLFFGAVVALFANYGLAVWLLTFVAGHGVLELTAIFIAGGAGLLIARAAVAPGDLTRRDALVVHGRLAIKLVGAAAFLLVIAGLIEGFISASGAPGALKFGVSAASAVFLVFYFAAGYRSIKTVRQAGGMTV